MSKPIWTPADKWIATSNMAAFIRYVNRNAQPLAGESTGTATAQPLYPHGGTVADYYGLYHWSIAHPEEFWAAVWRFEGIADGTVGQAATPAISGDWQAEPPAPPEVDPWDEVVVGLDRMAPPDPVLGPKWFPGARLNFAENLLRHCHGDDATTLEALVFYNEDGRQASLTYSQLWQEVAAFAVALTGQGIGPGDRVAGFMPNLPQAVIAMLATASIGAVWSSCSPDFGIKGVLDRFGQIAPKLLLCADSYQYNGRRIDSLERVRELIPQLPEIERVVVVPYLSEHPDIAGMPGTVLWDDFVGEAVGARHASPLGDPWVAPTIGFARLSFDHPLYIMYSSGTTGLPKCMVHSAGGTLIQHLKELALHSDLKRGDRIFYFTTCGWMMWNWLVSSLAIGATVVLYDGSPFAPAADSLWDMAATERLTHFGTSAKYLAMLEKRSVRLAEARDLSSLRVVLSTGSPLSPESYDYVYSHIKSDLLLASISGGTDIISCFALGCPIAPVFRGELQKIGLGMAVEIWNDTGKSVVGRQGELVCTKPFPSMPVAFWDDADNGKYNDAYFSHFDGVWRHGDWAELTRHGGLVMHGRSDATLNPGGVRIGTAEIYRVVEALDEVVEGLVIGQRWGDDTRIVLFVRLTEGCELTGDLKETIRDNIRSSCSPHHVPKKIIAVADIPRTISGKITELAVTDIVHGREVKNRDALANPDALELFKELAELSN